MSRINVESFDTETNKRRSEYRNTVLWMFNSMNVAFMLASKKERILGSDLTDTQIRIASGLLISTITTGENISKLLEPLSMCSKDALPLARTFYESSLIAAFVLCDSGQRAERIDLFSVYKLFKTRKRFYSIGSKKGVIESKLRLDRNSPLVARAISEFSKGRSGNGSRCFKESREEMIGQIGIISPSAAILFQGIELMAWEIASEVAHGSYFSFQLTNGKFPGIESDYAPEELAAFATHVVIMATDAVLKVISSRNPETHAAKETEQACNLYYQEEAPELSEKLKSIAGRM